LGFFYTFRNQKQKNCYTKQIQRMNRLLVFIFLIQTSFSFAQVKYELIDVHNKEFDEFEIFGDTLSHYKVYFTGENHTFATFNTDFQLKFLKFLHQTQGVNHLIFEQSPAVGYIMEKIVIEGKKSHQNYLLDMFYTPFYDFVKGLKKYNDTLAPEKKIHVHGIDAERFPYFSIYALNSIVDTLSTRFYGGEIFEQIKALASANYEDYNVETYYGEPDFAFDFEFAEVNAWSSLKSIIDDSNYLKDTLMNHLGADGPIYFAIIKSLEVGREWYLSERAGDLKSPIIRERFMCDEFERIFRLDQEGKYYGQFGRCHLHKDKKSRNCYDYYMNSVASRITEIDPSLTNTVLEIPIFYSENREMDGDVIDRLELKDKFLTPGTSYIIDLAYKGGNHEITGFYEKLPFVIICNEAADGYEDTYFSWQIPLYEYHLSGYYGYHYFNKIRNLNSALEAFNSIGFTDKFVTYNISLDYLEMNVFGGRLSFNYFPSISNNDGFELGGNLTSLGYYYPLGNKYVMAAFGMDMGYGRMTLTEESDNTVPNLIQQGGKNVNIYRNDMFVFDPNIELRLTLPVISFNFKTGYGFDVSGKFWKLDGKMKDFTKTSFSSPYIQAGISLNLKM
jgi:hypothetical protein